VSATLVKLVHMANQIADAFRQQEPAKAVAATYDHLWHFWDPRMRRLITEHLAAGGEGLGDIARAAVERLAISGTEPRPVTQATGFAPVQGESGSDAG
jgi:formate dehydrogenase subunit delta